MVRHFMISFALLLLLAAAAPGDNPAARVLWVSPAGQDSQPGTREAPLRSLQAALDRVQPGEQVRLTPGVHTGGAKSRCERFSIQGSEGTVLRGPAAGRALQLLHNGITVSHLTVELADIGIWVQGASQCRLEQLVVRDIGGEGVRIKNGSRDNRVIRCSFERMGRTGFAVERGRKNGEGVYIGTAPEQRHRNVPPNVPDRCIRNQIEECRFRTEAAEAVDLKEDSEENLVRDCIGEDSRDPDGAVFGSRGDRNRFEGCVARGGRGHGFRFGGDTVPVGRFGQVEARVYGKDNVMRRCVAEGNARKGVAAMVTPQDVDESNRY